MDHGMLVKKIFESTSEGRRRMGRPRLRWLEDAEKYLQAMKEIARKAVYREDWRL